MQTMKRKRKGEEAGRRRPEDGQNLGWSRRILFLGLTLVLVVTVISATGEVMVRLFVPEATFWPVSNIYEVSEISGLHYTYKPNYDGVAFGVDLKTNSLGFRGPEWAKEKKPDTFRIALVGDSHAFGFGVPFESSVGEVLASILEARYDMAAEVLNFGVNGYNGGQLRAALVHRALRYAPDLVVLIPTNNDDQPTLTADQDGWLHWDGLVENQKSRIVDRSIEDKSLEQAELDSAAWWVTSSRLLFYLKLMQGRRQFQQEAQAQRPSSPEQASARRWMGPLGPFTPGPVSGRLAETVYQPLKDILAQTTERQIPVIIAHFCSRLDYRQMFRIIERDHGVPVLELLALFPEAPSWEALTAEFGLGWNNHLSAVAHRRYAEGIADVIEAQAYHTQARSVESQHLETLQRMSWTNAEPVGG